MYVVIFSSRLKCDLGKKKRFTDAKHCSASHRSRTLPREG
jgi:hypothetical protein